jgi:hypothetical protein
MALAASGCVAVVIVAVVLLTGSTEVRGDPASLDCESGFIAVGHGMPSRSYESPREAAVAYASGPDGMGFATDTPILDVSDAFPASQGRRVFAVRDDGRTVAILRATGGGGGWAVDGSEVCSP